MLQFSALGDASSADITALQNSLVQLAIASNRPSVNPGTITGVLNDQTMAALAAGFDLLAGQLPWYAHYSLEAAFVLGAGTDTARAAVGSYSTELTIAAIAASKVVTPSYGAFPFLPDTSDPTSLLLLGIAALVVYKLFFKHPKKKDDDVILLTPKMKKEAA